MPTTLSQLRQATATLRPGYTKKLVNQANEVSIIKMTPHERSKTMTITGECLPVTGDHPYQVKIEFFGMDLVPAKTNTHTMPIKLQDGTVKWARQFSYKSTAVQVHCSCPDFRFVWSWWDNSIGGLLGKPRKYKRKTPPPPVGRPEVNPPHTPGLCKHLISMSLRLNQEGIIT